MSTCVDNFQQISFTKLAKIIDFKPYLTKKIGGGDSFTRIVIYLWPYY